MTTNHFFTIASINSYMHHPFIIFTDGDEEDDLLSERFTESCFQFYIILKPLLSLIDWTGYPIQCSFFLLQNEVVLNQN